ISGATAEPKAPRISEEDSDESAPIKYRYLTQDAPANMAFLHEAITRILSNSDQIAQFWGFRFARALLGDKGFQPLIKFLPPTAYIDTQAKNAYFAEPTLSPYFRGDQETSERTAALVTQALGRLDRQSEPTLEAARQIGLGDTLPPAFSKQLVDGTLQSHVALRSDDRINSWTSVMMLPLWAAAAALTIGSIGAGSFLIAPTWPFWAKAATFFFLYLASLIDTVARLGSRDSADAAFREAGLRLGTARTIAPKLQAEDRARIADFSEFMLRLRRRAEKNEYSTDDSRRAVHWQAAGNLEALRDELSSERIRAIVELVMAQAEKPSKENPMADRLAPLMIFELLDPYQKERAVSITLEHLNFVLHDDDDLAARFLHIARAGHIPQKQQQGLIENLSRLLRSDRWNEEIFSGVAQTIGVLAAKHPENIRLAAYKAIFDARDWFSGNRATAPHSPAYYDAVLKLSRHRKTIERVADHILELDCPKADQLSWLLSLPDLDEDRRKKTTTQLRAAARGPLWEDAPWRALNAVARQADIPREQRIQLLLEALKGLGSDGESVGPNFQRYVRAADSLRLLAELNSVSAPH
ncbi:MAG: hypothetical protein AAB036_08620, partial [Elusimicrobiota bacterium]